MTPRCTSDVPPAMEAALLHNHCRDHSPARLASGPKVLILDEPTHGIDVGAKADVLAIISELAREGVGIILISSEMEEVRAMSDRLLVMRMGRITGRFDSQVNSNTILAAATGQHGAIGVPA